MKNTRSNFHYTEVECSSEQEVLYHLSKFTRLRRVDYEIRVHKPYFSKPFTGRHILSVVCIPKDISNHNVYVLGLVRPTPEVEDDTESD